MQFCTPPPMPALALASIFVNPGDTTSSSNEMPMPMTDDDGPSIASSHPPPPSLTWASVLTTTSSGHLFGSAGLPCAQVPKPAVLRGVHHGSPGRHRPLPSCQSPLPIFFLSLLTSSQLCPPSPLRRHLLLVDARYYTLCRDRPRVCLRKEGGGPVTI